MIKVENESETKIEDGYQFEDEIEVEGDVEMVSEHWTDNDFVVVNVLNILLISKKWSLMLPSVLPLLF